MKSVILKSASDKPIEFVDGVESTDPRMVMTTFGPFGSGKSRFAVTAPEVVGIVPMDRKTRKTVEKTLKELKDAGTPRRVLMPKEDFVRQVNPMQVALMSEEACIKHYTDHVTRVKDAIWALHANKDVQTIVIDTCTQLYLDICYSRYGREFKPKKIGEKNIQDRSQANQDLIDLVNSISSKHVIMTNKDKDEYIRNKQTGRTTWQGYKDLGFLSNVIIEHELNPKWKPDGTGEDWRFGISIVNVQERTDLCMTDTILTDDMISFSMLAQIIYPDVEWPS